MITSIHALRGLAALAVVILHSGYIFFGIFASQFQAVSIFFVISGFIVAYITEKGTDEFLNRRIIRIVPVYWLLTIVALFWYSLGQFDWIDRFVVDPVHGVAELLGPLKQRTIMFRSLFLIPYRDGTSGEYTVLLYPGWTLAIECLFYVLFAMFARFGRRTAMVAVSIFFLSCNALRIFTDVGGILSFYGREESLYIVCGFIVYFIWNRFRYEHFSALARRWTVISSACLAVIFFGLHLQPVIWPVSVSLDGLRFCLPPLVVLASLLLHTAGVRFTSPAITFLGDISYSLYLVHTIVMATFSRYADVSPVLDTRGSFVSTLLAIAVSCFFAWALHVCFEKPIIKWGHRKLQQKRASAVQGLAV